MSEDELSAPLGRKAKAAPRRFKLPVTIARVVDIESVIASGLDGGETVVTNGQLLLSNGTKVAPRGPKVGS